ncbi:hypothetical protein [Streptococcus gallolyticus]|uniref:Uncharacterized protein n=1 Tax=Streptococcus gallolyticus TaxID=315405 RepID=A0A1H9PDW7_9STRE|nr:hypothetical protein [Streptococcus gallolyticus]SER46115.1 hypothetical protein SAMN04487840_10479 [Streptococcus gallolyticus]
MNLKSLFGIKLSEAIASDNQIQAFLCLKSCYQILLENKNDIEVKKVTVDKKTLLYLNFLAQFRVFSHTGDYIECCRLLEAVLGFKITRGVINNMLYCLHEIDGKVVANDD